MKKYFSQPYFFYLALSSFGISFGFNFQLTYLSSIFNFLGAEAQQLPLLWLVPPITGLIIPPLIGQISDDTMTDYGKRRPYIIGSGVLTVLSFFLMPSANTLFYAILLTWMIDASLNVSLEALRALTTDLSQQKERSKAFALQAFFGGIGAAIGTGLPYMMNKVYVFFDHSPLLEKGKIPVNLKLSFIFTGIIIGLMVFISMRNVKERSYSHKMLLAKKKEGKSFSLFKRSIKTFKDLGVSIKKSSSLFKKICFIHSMTWFGIFVFWLYFTTVLAQNFYGLPVMLYKHHRSLEYIHILQKSTLDASGYLSIFQYINVIYSLFLFFILESTEKIKLIHSISLFIGGIGMMILCFAKTKITLILAMIGIGIMSGSMAILPYIVVSQILPKGKFGVYLGIFNISITLPQIMAGLTLSPIYTYIFHGHANDVIFLGGLMIIISASLWLRET